MRPDVKVSPKDVKPGEIYRGYDSLFEGRVINHFCVVEIGEGDLSPRPPVEAEDSKLQTLGTGLEEMVTRLNDQMELNRQEQIRLAQNKNVFIESGGITWLFNYEFYPYPSAVDAINEAADLVGFEKLMWGSDYPRTMTAITYKMSYDFIEKTDEISEENKKLLLGENARNFYGFGDLPVPVKVKNMVED